MVILRSCIIHYIFGSLYKWAHTVPMFYLSAQHHLFPSDYLLAQTAPGPGPKPPSSALFLMFKLSGDKICINFYVKINVNVLDFFNLSNFNMEFFHGIICRLISVLIIRF